MQRSPHAGPRFGKLAIPKDAIGRLIGPGGTYVNALQDRTRARIVISDAGAVQFYAPDAQQAAAVKSSIEALTGTGLQVYICPGNLPPSFDLEHTMRRPSPSVHTFEFLHFLVLSHANHRRNQPQLLSVASSATA